MKRKRKKASRKDNPAKKRGKRRAPRKANPPKRKRAKRRAKRAANPPKRKRRAKRRARKSNMTERAGDKRYKRRSRRKARKDNPHGRKRRRSSRKRNMTSRQGDRRYARKRSKSRRKDNPLGLRLGNPTGNWGNIAALGVATLGGYITAEFVDRFVATRAGGKSPNKGADPFTGINAITEINAPPDGMRMGAQGALAILFLVGGFFLAKKKHDTLAYIATGAGIGAAVHLGAQIWYDNAVPMFAVKADTKADPNAKPTFFGDRIYPELTKERLEAASAAAKALRTAGHSTLSAPPAARGPVGSPRMVARPPATVGCGADMAAAAAIQQLRAERDQLVAQLSAARANRMADGPETRQPEYAPPAAPPAPAARDNVHSISKAYARFA